MPEAMTPAESTLRPLLHPRAVDVDVAQPALCRSRLPDHDVPADGREEARQVLLHALDDVLAARDVAHVDRGAGLVVDRERAALAAAVPGDELSLIHISEPTRLGMSSY